MAMLMKERLHDDFGAQVTGLDLSSDLTYDEIEVILEAIDEFSLLVFPVDDKCWTILLRLQNSF